MRVLILAYDFPPNSSIGGQRPYSWFKYFKDFGVKPVVVTRHWSEISTPEDTIKPSGNQVEYTENESGTLIRVPFRPNLRDKMLLRFGYRFALLRKILSLWYSLSQFHLPFFDNRRNIYHEARAYLKKNPCEAIIATGEPFILFQYAKLLSREFNIPWVADYRDGWSTDYHIVAGTSRIEKWINSVIIQRLEKKIVYTCSLITTPAPAFKEDLLRLHPSKRIEVIYNGYFHELFENPQSLTKETTPFVIAYSGTMYPFQKLELFLDGFDNYIRSNSLTPSQISVNFIGLEYQPGQLNRVLKYLPRLTPYIQTSGRKSHLDALKALQNADVFLLLTNAQYGQIYAKAFDYIAFAKPILMCEDDNGPLHEILEIAGCGYYASNPKEVEKQLTRIRQSAAEQIKSSNVSMFTRKHQAERFFTLLQSLLDKTS
jgi:glycosyltransferase involved in cell wall biosynthesis